jgi:hypothetical protein
MQESDQVVKSPALSPGSVGVSARDETFVTGIGGHMGCCPVRCGDIGCRHAGSLTEPGSIRYRRALATAIAALLIFAHWGEKVVERRSLGGTRAKPPLQACVVVSKLGGGPTDGACENPFTVR